jgi:hypothetical protein
VVLEKIFKSFQCICSLSPLEKGVPLH